MMNNENISMHSSTCHCLAWKPIIAGALIAVGLSFLLNLFSVAIGLTAFTADSDGVETLALGGLLGTSIGIIASMFAAGWIAGYLSQGHCTKRHLGAVYGFLTWCLALILAIFLASHAQQYVSYYGHAISGTGATFQVNNASGTASITTNDASSNAVVISTYIIFSLFFLSAFACSLGGHCGMRHLCKNER